jgi:Domain of unknown function (DUF4915)/Calx-beta domain/Dockerin type I domain
MCLDLGLECLEVRMVPAGLNSLGDASIAEGDDGQTPLLNFSVNRSGDLNPQVTVSYHTEDGSAHSGVDYTAESGTVVIPAGSSTATTGIPITGNQLLQMDRNFRVVFDNVTDVNFPFSLADAQSIATGNSPVAVATGDLNGSNTHVVSGRTNLSWANISRIVVTFNSAVDPTVDDLTVTGVGGRVYSVTGVSVAGNTVTWTLGTPISAADIVTITVDPGLATYTAVLRLLPGNVNDDGVVNSQDLVIVRNALLNLGPVSTFPSVYFDLNGDIVVEEGGRVVFVATHFGCLATFSERFSFTPLWRPPYISKLAPEDRCRLNGLALEEGRCRYVTAVSTFDVVDGWRDRRRDGGVVLEVPEGRVVASGLPMPHSHPDDDRDPLTPGRKQGCLETLIRHRGVLDSYEAEWNIARAEVEQERRPQPKNGHEESPEPWLATSDEAALRAMVARIPWAVLRKLRS